MQVHVQQVVSGHLVRFVEGLDDCHRGINCNNSFKLIIKVRQSSIEHEGGAVSTQALVVKFLRTSVVQSVRKNVVFELSDINWLQSSNLPTMSLDLFGNVNKDIM